VSPIFIRHLIMDVSDLMVCSNFGNWTLSLDIGSFLDVHYLVNWFNGTRVE
jgi:hypothetical protein